MSTISPVRFWVCYEVTTIGVVYVRKNYDDGHSFKCKWTAFVNDLTAHANKDSWRIAEDTDTRKVVAYTDEILSMTVFQLVVLEPPILPGPDAFVYLTDAGKTDAGETDAGSKGFRGYRHRRPARQGERITVGQCIADGSHLTDCDDDGFCNFCGE